MEHRWLITGAGGKLGSVLLGRLCREGRTALGTVSPAGARPFVGDVKLLDLMDIQQTEETVRSFRPTIIVHAAAVSSPASVRAAPERAWAVNVALTALLTELAAQVGSRLVYTSTDMVFDGEDAPYDELSSPGPTTEYGRTKLAGEREALRSASSLVLRVPLLYGVPASRRTSHFVQLVRDLRAGRPTTLFADEYRTPLWLEDAAMAVQLAATHDVTGVLHLGGPERLSRLDMGHCVARSLGLQVDSIVAGNRTEADDPEPRPRDLSLSSDLFREALGVAPGRRMEEAVPLALQEER
jgi:dTDP-4-dehydrorhamnose reductase